MPLINMMTNRLVNPLGFELGSAPRFSWVTVADGKNQKSARIEVSLTENFETVLFDSGFDTSIDSICYPLKLDLSPRTRYFWRVTVITDKDETITSDIAWFETAKLNEPWQAEWISPDANNDYQMKVGTSFALEKAVKSARVYICGLGLYEINLNGAKSGDEFLSPGLVAYDKWLPYQTYDITQDLKNGENTVEILLGNGWYKGRYGLKRSAKPFQYGDELATICEIVLTFEDGETRTIGTNTKEWQARRINITASSIFDGETRDDTLIDDKIYAVKPSKLAKSLLEPRRSPPTKIMHRIKPIEIIRTLAGEIVLDMGQNMVGWLEFRSTAPKGEEVYLQFGEVLQGGNFYRDNLRTALCEYRYTSDGNEKLVRPYFTFYGFRFVKLTKWHGEVNLDDFTGLVLYSDIAPTGNIVTSNDKVNKLFENTLWGQRGNYLDAPTDCPQRDERMGWTGDAQVFFGTAAFNTDVYAFFTKYCYDLAREQQALGGNVPVVVPKHDVVQAGACAWGDAATIIPWSMYVRYGDKEILSQQYESMKAWVDYIRGCDQKHGNIRLWRGDFHYGDWLALDSEDPIGYRFGGTEHTYLASCFYRYSARLVAKAAKVLGKNDDASFYEKLSDEVRSAILREYMTETGRLALTTQTAYVLALYMDIIPDEFREQTANALRLKLKSSNFHLRTGFIGTPYLCRVLSNSGGNDIAYRLLMQEDFPSWLYEINMGATTIWERWNSILPDGSISDTGMNSLNHYSYGSIVEWMYRDAAGINPNENHVGFRQFDLAPKPHYFLNSVAAEYHSPCGTIKSSWKLLQNGELEFSFTVPFGATAKLTLPDCSIDYPNELTAGVYSFKYMPTHAVKPELDLDTPISEIYKIPAAAAVLEAELPKLTGLMLFSMLAGDRSLNDFINEGLLELDGESAADLARKMAKAVQ